MMKFKIHIILCLYLISLFYALLEPFDFDFRTNNVKWLQAKNGVRFDKDGKVISEGSTPELYQILTEGKGLTLEVWISTYNVFQDGPARILSYSINTALRNFTLGQSKDKLEMRLRTEITDLNGVEPHIEVANVFEAKSIYHIVVTYDFEKECVFINGKKRLCDGTVRGKFSNWDPSFKLVIGNEVTGDRPWLGEIYHAAIYNQALDNRVIKTKYETGLTNTVCPNADQVSDGMIPVVCYPFKEKEGNTINDAGLSAYKFNLHIPDRLLEKEPILKAPFYKNLKDNLFTMRGLFNILGFIPLGYFLHRLMRARFKLNIQTVSIVLITGLFVSLACEILQHFLPTRSPQITDVFTNLAGVGFGIIIDKLTSHF